MITVLAGCVPLPGSQQQGANQQSRTLQNRFSVAPQVSPPRNIQTVQLYRKGAPASPPIIKLGSSERLMLEFDRLDAEARQFKATVRHYSREWEESSLGLNSYIDGFYEQFFGGGSKSYVQRPTYRHYEYELPNDQISLTTSGNYLLSIHDADTGNLLFSVPFFVTEDEGELQTSIKTEYARRQDLREQDRPFSEYIYPDFVELPQFDLSFTYVQNQFWGRAREVTNFDTSTPGTVNFHLAQDEAFLGDYEFNTLNISTFNVDGTRILSYDPETIPPTILLRRDIQAFSPMIGSFGGSRYGLPVDDRGGEYANVQFQFEPATPADSLQQIYLVGDFNNWSVNRLNKMELNASEGLWEGTAFIKQGEYAYKYVTVEGNRINDLALDRSFTYRSQEYVTLVYYRDPTQHYDRLLKVDRSLHSG